MFFSNFSHKDANKSKKFLSDLWAVEQELRLAEGWKIVSLEEGLNIGVGVEDLAGKVVIT